MSIFNTLRNKLSPTAPARVAEEDHDALRAVVLDGVSAFEQFATDVFDRTVRATLPDDALGEFVCPHNTSLGFPFAVRVMSADGRNVRLALGICRHPGLGPVFACVNSASAGWHTTYPEYRAALTGSDGRFRISPAGVIFIPRRELKGQSVVEACESVLRASSHPDRLMRLRYNPEDFR